MGSDEQEAGKASQMIKSNFEQETWILTEGEIRKTNELNYEINYSIILKFTTLNKMNNYWLMYRYHRGSKELIRLSSSFYDHNDMFPSRPPLKFFCLTSFPQLRCRIMKRSWSTNIGYKKTVVDQCWVWNDFRSILIVLVGFRSTLMVMLHFRSTDMVMVDSKSTDMALVDLGF